MISIIIPLWNRYEHFTQCIRSLERHRHGFEIVVVDFGSTDGDVELRLKVAGVPYKLVKIKGPFVRTVALNAGVQAADGDPVFFLDADMTVPHGFIRMIEEKVTDRHAWFPRCIVQTADGIVSPNDPLSVNGFGNCGVTLTDYRLAGGFDEGLRVWGKEDKAFHDRLRAEGVSVERAILPDFLHHYHPPMKEGELRPAPLVSSSPPPTVQVSPPPPPPPKPAPLVPPARPPVAKPVDIGPKPQKPSGPQKDVLLATYSPEHTLYLARLRPYFEARGFAVYEKSGTRDYAWLTREKADVIIVWNGSLPEQQGNLEYVRHISCKHLLIAEVGWFPGVSKETGSAATLCLDRKGINAKSEIVGFKPPAISVEMTDELKAWLKAHRKLEPARKGYTLVPLQLETDTNIASGSPHFQRMQDLIDFVETHVEGRLIFRKHPRDEKGEYTVRNRKSEITTEGDLYEQIAKAKQVVGINSTVLLESLMFGKRVAAFGHGLFDGHDVILDCTDDPEDVFKLKKQFGRHKVHKERVAAFLYELIFRRQIEFAHLEETMSRNRVMQEVLAQCG